MSHENIFAAYIQRIRWARAIEFMKQRRVALVDSVPALESDPGDEIPHPRVVPF